MGMPFELNTKIVTKGKEKRVEDNVFVLEKEGYRLYPLDIPIEVRKTKTGESVGTAFIRRVELSDEQTIIKYELISLNSTN